MDTTNARPVPPRMLHWKRVLLAHGGGGQLTDDLVGGVVLPRLGNSALNELLDSGIAAAGGERLALTIDSYVVQPLEFPGGDIGKLAVCGTINDLAVCGARPLALAMSLILQEGLERSVLERVMDSAAATAKEAGVAVITGDTKVVGHGQGDGVYITTAGLGHMRPGLRLHPDQVRPGDAILVNGPIADHGLAVMLAREMPQVTSVLKSDVAPLNTMIQGLLDRVPGIKFMRDATRGGLAGVAADLASRTGLHVVLDEAQIVVRPETRHAAEMLGLDPLDVANEGKVVVVVEKEKAPLALKTLREYIHGVDSRLVGWIEDQPDGICELRTTIGGRRVLQKPYGEQLPRIC